MNLFRMAVGCLALLIVGAVAFSGQSDEIRAQQGAVVSAEDAAIIDAALSVDGRVSVIVGIDIPFAVQHEGDAKADPAQQAAIDSARDSLIDTIAAAGDVVVLSESASWVIPFTALEVDAAAYQALSASPNVSSITINRANRPTLSSSTPIVEANAMWAQGFTGTGRAVAVLDTGVLTTHSAVSGRVVAEACYSGAGSSSRTLCPNLQKSQTGTGAASPARCRTLLGIYAEDCSHGTHVASTVMGNNSVIKGVAPDAAMIGVQVFSEQALFVVAYDSDIIAGLNYVYGLRTTYAIDAVNLSLGGSRFYATCNNAVPSMTSMFSLLRSAGIMPVVSSGNDGWTDSMGYPACISHAVSVGATTDADLRASFSNSLPSVMTLFAPGVSIYAATTATNTSYSSYNGTSMAAPHVAGAFALLRGAVPSASAEQVLTALRNTGVPITVPGGTTPRIRIQQAYSTLTGTTVPTPTPPPTTTPAPTAPANDQFSGAFSVNALPFTTTQSGINTATTTNDPTGWCNVGSHIVWYRYRQTSGSTKTLILDTFGSSYDTVLGVFTAPITTGSAPIVCNDDAPSGTLQSQVTLNAASGTTYYIAIGKWGSATTSALSLTLNVRQQTGTLGGTLGVEGRTNLSGMQARVRLVPASGGAAVHDAMHSLNSSGGFSIANLPTGTYHVWVKVPNTLSATVSSVTLTTGTVTIAVGTLRNGDINGDNQIGLGDFTMMSAAFGTNTASPAYNAAADLNGDGAINVTDFSLFAANFGRSGSSLGAP